jgi:hypothetical protein
VEERANPTPRRDREQQSLHTPLPRRDRELLTFVSEHRFVLSEHLQALLDVSRRASARRLRSLSSIGAVRHEPPSIYQITRKGLALIGSELPAPRMDWHCYRHDIGVAWLWLAARSGTWGPLREVLAERRMRSVDATRQSGEAPLSVRLGGLGPGGRERLHYPDLLLITPGGHRIALELELSRKGRSQRERILAAYGADPRIDVVLYLVEDAAIAHALAASAQRMGTSDRVQIQPVRWVTRPYDAAPASWIRAPHSRRHEQAAAGDMQRIGGGR